MVDGKIVLIKKNDVNTPWSIQIDCGERLRFTIGPKGQVPIGPRLARILTQAKNQIETYPFTYGMTTVKQNENKTVNVSFLGSYPSMVEITEKTQQYMSKSIKNTEVELFWESLKLNTEEQIYSEQSTVSHNFDIKEEEIVETDEHRYIVLISPGTELPVNGDGIKGNVMGYIWPKNQKLPTRLGDYDFNVGRPMLFKYSEIFTPKLESIINTPFNRDFANRFGITMNASKYVADEAYLKNTTEMNKQGIIAVSLQYDKDKEGYPIFTLDGKPIGIPYRLNVKDRNEILDKVDANQLLGFNIDKEMLKDPSYANFDKNMQSKKERIVPKATYEPSHQYQTNLPGIDTSRWHEDMASFSGDVSLASFSGWTDNIKNAIKGKAEADKKAKEKDNEEKGLPDWHPDLPGWVKPNPNNPTDTLPKTPGVPDIVDPDKKEDEIEKIITTPEAEREQEKRRKDKEGKEGKRQEAIPDEPDDATLRSYDLTPTGYQDNSNAFVPPLDDRFEEMDIYGDVEENGAVFEYRNKVRIGDVMLPIPPLNIRVDKQFMNNKIHVMRAASSLQTMSGSSRSTISMDLFIADEEGINGKAINAPVNIYGEEENNKWYVDGLRPLLAQFKKAPFLPIDNEYVNETLHVHNVAMKNLFVETIPDYPKCLKVTLELEEFNTGAYFIEDLQMEEVINYPLLRWYYQHSLVEKSSQKYMGASGTRATLLSKFKYGNDGTVGRDVTFKIPDPEALEQRKQDLTKLRKMKSPREYIIDIKTGDGEASQKYYDGYRAAKAIREANQLNELAGNDKFPMFTGRGEVKFLMEEKVKKYFEKAVKNAIEFYGEDPKHKGFSKELKKVGQKPENTAVFNFDTKQAVDNMGPTFINQANPKVAEAAQDEDGLISYHGPVARVAFFSEEAKDYFSECETEIERSDGAKYFIIPMTDNLEINGEKKPYLTNLGKIAEYKKEYQDDVSEYEDTYNELLEAVVSAEKETDMLEQNIPDVTVTGLTFNLANNFSMIQTQAGENPTLQYFGGMDPQIQLTIETNSQGVSKFDSMFRTVGHNIRTYREGIVSGFLEVNNPLLNSFGVQYVLPENVVFETVPNFPDRKIVTLSLTGFNVQQRKQEELYSYNGADPSSDKKDRAYGSYDPKKDNAYVSKKLKQLELYPDMELPMVSELNSDIQELDCGLDSYETPTNQVYLDPDFYVSTFKTLRNMVKDLFELKDDETIRTEFEDSTGIEVTSDLEGDQPYNISEEDLEHMADLYDDIEYNDPIKDFKWKDQPDSWADAQEKNDSAQSASDEKSLEYRGGDLSGDKADFLKDDLDKFPSFDEFKKFQSYKDLSEDKVKKKYDEFKKQHDDGEIKAPLPEDVWKEIARRLLHRMPSSGLEMPSEEADLIANNKEHPEVEEKYYKSSDRKFAKYSFSPAENVYAHYYNAWLHNKSAKNSTLANGKKPNLKKGENYDQLFSMRESASNNNMPRPTFQRAMMYLKAMIDLTGNWAQFDNGKVKVSGTNKDKVPIRIGLMGVYIGQMKEETIKEVAWDWRANVKHSVGGLMKGYEAAMATDYIEIKSRALDWGVVYCSGEKMPEVINDQL